MAATRLDQYITFEYPVTRPFSHRWKYANWFLLIFGVLSLVGLSAVNVDLVGYDVVSTNSDNFNMTDALSWLESWKGKSDGCQTHQFQLGDTFRTNTSAFTYKITNIVTQNKDVQGSFVYANNTLEDCDVTEVQTSVSLGDRQVEVVAAINCSARGFEASTSYAYTNHDVIGTISASTFPENSLPRAILDQMKAFGQDAYTPIYDGQYVLAENITTSRTHNVGDPLYKVIATFVPYCADDNTTICDTRPEEWELTMYNGIAQSDLSIVADASNCEDAVKASLDTLLNYVQVFYAGIRLDLGHWTPNNIFTNVTAINDTIYDPVDPATGSQASIARSSNTGLAYVNLTSPPTADVASPPAVAKLQYICSTRRIKAPGTLFMSVATSTLSMFITAWAILTTAMAMMAKRTIGANTCAACNNGVEPLSTDYWDNRVPTHSLPIARYDPVELGSSESMRKRGDRFEVPAYINGGGTYPAGKYEEEVTVTESR
ncbi:uncharacterized protein STEHIDRAFT_121476 [Stereum hirsutum FP-91666 SS1]|uniref:uncharacterized protein n=1 Tax=Stereum hirsutum (strain FP-91666) TaxID=721885 RepID=UPI000440C63F|nr:uncharacterized protein STEHIDRAFT_121476 [Stereum hirsutum FP-91666 SS1]EIM86560.1 hypothetical protein STEHIDRAFT_121476 [Stereum hirsutum FP-91666 SS1]